jgi:thiol:disulfide interchange protein DsbC
MKKILVSLTATALLSTTLIAKEVKSEANKYLPKNKVMNMLKLLPNSDKIINAYKNHAINIYAQDKGDFYIFMVKGERRGQFFVSKDKKYIIFGNIVNAKTKKSITGNIPLNKNLIKKGVAFTYGVGDKTVYLVTDPECPYCRMFENKKGDMIAKKYKVKVVLFPLPFHKYALPMTKYILAGKTNDEKAARMRRILHGSNEWKNFKPTSKQEEKINAKLLQMQKAVNELGARGTPTVYDSNFKQIPLSKIYNEK